MTYLWPSDDYVRKVFNTTESGIGIRTIVLIVVSIIEAIYSFDLKTRYLFFPMFNPENQLNSDTIALRSRRSEIHKHMETWPKDY